jgi:hypothetical protein
MKRLAPAILLLFLGIVLSPSAFAQTEVKVRLSVTADEELTRELVQCLEPRLTASPGVQIETDAEVELRLIALQHKMSNGDTFGYVFYQAGLVSSKDSEGVFVLWETLRSLPPDFPAACDRLASAYQTEVIVPVREGIERFRQDLEGRAPSPP